MPRRRPYAELPGVELSTSQGFPAENNSEQLKELNTLLSREPPASSPNQAGLHDEAAARYRTEITILTGLIQSYRLTADPGGLDLCSYASKKLAKASVALDRGDGEGCWFHIFGAATLCRSFGVYPEEAERALHRLDLLL